MKKNDDPIDTIKTFGILDDPDSDDIYDAVGTLEDDDADSLSILDDLRYHVGQTDRHGIPLDAEYWEEY